MSTEEYIVREAQQDDIPEIMEFLWEHFFPRENAMSAYFKPVKSKISEEEQRNFDQDLQQRFENMLSCEPCLLAVHCESQKIVGINIITVEENPQFSTNVTGTKHVYGVKDPSQLKSQWLTDWFTHVLQKSDEVVNFFDKYPEMKGILHVEMLGVHSNHGRRGVATRLLNECIEWAKEKNLELVWGVFTSPYSAKAAQNLGFETYADIDWLSFRHPAGNRFYEGMGSHNISVKALKL